MFNTKAVATACFSIVCFFGFNAISYAQECGDVPVEPSIIDGSIATMDDMVAGSEAVNAFIASADGYLDCREGFIKTDTFDALEGAAKKSYRRENKAVLDARNGLGEKFNAQVKAYKKANP